MGLLNVGSRVFYSKGGTAGAVGLGVGAALDRADMGTWSMDWMEDTLLGTTTADEAFTGGQRSITSPFSLMAASGLSGGFSRAFNMISPVTDIAMPPPLRYMNSATSAYRDAASSQMSVAELGMRTGSNRYNRTPNQAIDGSMVFGMYNLRR